MNPDEASNLHKGAQVRLVTELEGIPLGATGTVLSVHSHEDLGGGIEVCVDWTEQGPGFMDPEVLERTEHEARTNSDTSQKSKPEEPSTHLKERHRLETVLLGEGELARERAEKARMKPKFWTIQGKLSSFLMAVAEYR